MELEESQPARPPRDLAFSFQPLNLQGIRYFRVLRHLPHVPTAVPYPVSEEWVMGGVALEEQALSTAPLPTHWRPPGLWPA